MIRTIHLIKEEKEKIKNQKDIIFTNWRDRFLAWLIDFIIVSIDFGDIICCNIYSTLVLPLLNTKLSLHKKLQLINQISLHKKLQLIIQMTIIYQE